MHIVNLQIDQPIDLTTIEKRAQKHQYDTPADFEANMMLLFSNARRVLVQGTTQYAMVCVLQRFYNQLTSWPTGASHAEVQAHLDTVSAAAAANIMWCESSVPLGPGYVTPPPEGFGEGDGSELLPSTVSPLMKACRVPTRDRTYETSVPYKGNTYRPGDFVHLINPSDPSKPIVGQIFRVFRRVAPDLQPGTTPVVAPTEEPRRSCAAYVSLCWYYRPEDTVHPASRCFFAGEVQKTGLVVDHLVQDLLEPTCVMYLSHYLHGRPEWWAQAKLAGRGAGEPYVTQFRYNEQHRYFTKIKSWPSCLPEDLRCLYKEPTLIPSEDQNSQALIAQEASPFLQGIRGPGRLCKEEDVKRPSAARVAPIGEDLFPSALTDPISSGNKKRKRPSENQASNPHKPLAPGSQGVLPDSTSHPGTTSTEPLPPGTLDPRNAHRASYNDLAQRLGMSFGDVGPAIAHRNFLQPLAQSGLNAGGSNVDLMHLASQLVTNVSPGAASLSHLNSTAGVLGTMRDAAACANAPEYSPPTLPGSHIKTPLLANPVGLLSLPSTSTLTSTPTSAPAGSPGAGGPNFDEARNMVNMIPTATWGLFGNTAPQPASPASPASSRSEAPDTPPVVPEESAAPLVWLSNPLPVSATPFKRRAERSGWDLWALMGPQHDTGLPVGSGPLNHANVGVDMPMPSLSYLAYAAQTRNQGTGSAAFGAAEADAPGIAPAGCTSTVGALPPTETDEAAVHALEAQLTELDTLADPEPRRYLDWREGQPYPESNASHPTIAGFAPVVSTASVGSFCDRCAFNESGAQQSFICHPERWDESALMDLGLWESWAPLLQSGGLETE